MLSNELYSCFLNLLNNGIDLISLGIFFQILIPLKVTLLRLISVLIAGKKKSFSCPGICLWASFDLNNLFIQLGNRLLLIFHIKLPIVNSLYESKFNVFR